MIIADSNVAVPNWPLLTLNSDSFTFRQESPETGILNEMFDLVRQNNKL
jgi:hypothetical protein